MDCNLLDSSVHGVLQARILEWVAMPSSRGSSQPRDRTLVSCVSCMAGGFFTVEPPGKPFMKLASLDSHINRCLITTWLFQWPCIFLPDFHSMSRYSSLLPTPGQLKGLLCRTIQPSLFPYQATVVCQHTLETQRDCHSSPRPQFTGDSDGCPRDIPSGLQNPIILLQQTEKSKTSSPKRFV